MENEKRFIELPETQLVRKLAVPGLMTMLFSSLYMVADGIFVGLFLGSQTLAAVNLVFPFLAIAYALGDMIAIGSSVKIAILLGQKRMRFAQRLFSGSMLLIFLLSIGFQILGFIGGKQLIFYFISDAQLAQLAWRYIRVYLIFLPITTQLFSIDNYLRICGQIKLCMTINIAASLLNVVLDAVLIGGLKLGIEMSALASSLSMCVGVWFSLRPFWQHRIALRFRAPRIYWREILGIVANGSSEFLNKISFSGVAILINYQLLKLGGGTAVAAYAAVLYIDHALSAIFYGILDALQPALSYNFGAQQWQRTRRLLKITTWTIFLIALGSFVGTGFWGKYALAAFIPSSDQLTLQAAQHALRCYWPGMLWGWVGLIAGSFWTNFDRPGESFVIMALRAVIFPIALALLLPLYFGVTGIYLISAVSGFLTGMVAVGLWLKRPMLRTTAGNSTADRIN